MNLENIYEYIDRGDDLPLEKILAELKDAFLKEEFKNMHAALLRGEAVEIPGVGRIEVRQPKSYTLENPKNGEMLLMAPQRKIVYVPARALVGELSNGVKTASRSAPNNCRL